MMCRCSLAALSAAAILLLPARADEEPKLADTNERLTADEQKDIRLAVYDNGPKTASPDLLKRPYPRVLVVPKVLKTLYNEKPAATVRLLLKIVEGGRAWDSIHAVCLIEALVESPEFGAIQAQGANPDKWDDVIGEANPHTRREHSRRVCVKFIARREEGNAGKVKD